MNFHVLGGRLLPAALFFVFALSLATGVAPGTARAQDAAAPDINELPAGPGREEVFYNCYACHSFMIIKRQRLSAPRWDELMDWMAERHGMPPLSPEDRKAVVTYLSTHFGEKTPR
ncbi:MAG: hypothetical protein RL477_1298 [Pseudomonadota bacterium]|jgi:mono/diheme cytochrome c family protein